MSRAPARIAVAGGSSPFVAGLVEAWRAAASPPGDLVLHGRDEDALAAVGRYAAHRLRPTGWRVTTTRRLGQALDGATVVVHQIRYGGLAGRAADERIATALGVPADETLGPGGLQAAVRTASGVLEFAAAVRTGCPDAVVLNLTNPLSVTTALLAAEGVTVLGLCELPTVTAHRIAALLGRTPSELTWSYTGLNHRGFLHDLRIDGDDVLEPLAATLTDRAALGVLGEEVRALGAVPLSYFRLFAAGDDHGHGSGRAAQLASIRTTLLAELARDPARPPPSLGRRDMPWYAVSVRPVVDAVTTGTPVDTVMNLAAADGLVHEVRAVVAGRETTPFADAAPPAPVGAWLRRFVAHERAVLDAAREPSAALIRTALELDPLLPPDRVDAAVRLLAEGGIARP